MIELTNIWKTYGTTEVLKGINLTIKEGEFTTIRGKSGAGKSSLLKIIGFIEPPTQGEVKLFQKTIQGLSDSETSNLRLNNIGFIFQFFNLIPTLTVQENIELPLALAKVNKAKRKERTQELLTYFELTKLSERFPENLSGGERQRIAVIRALSNNPKIIIADEPTSSLDDENSQLLMNLLKTINQNTKVTIIMTTTELCEKLPATTDYTLKDGQLHKNPNQN
jgi:putative ABC transport system ATP-binding protein